MSNKADAVAITDEGTSYAELGHARLYVWNTSTLVWERMIQPGGSGGGGAVTIANGADVATGNTADAAWVSGSGTVISLLKKIASAGGSAVSVADGADVAQGTTTDLSSANTVIGILKAIKAAVQGTLTVATHAVTQSGTWTVQPGNTANTTAWKVDGSAVTQPVSGTVTANVGTTNGLALDATLTGGTQKTKLVDTGGTNVGSISAAGALKVDNSAVTQPVSGTVTANQGGTWTVQPGNTANTTAWKVDGSAVTQPVSVASTVSVEQVPGTNGGYSISKLLAAASTNATSVKASGGKVFGWYLANAAASTVFFKLYNKASAPTVGTDVPVMTIPVPAGAAANVEFQGGIAFATGVAFAITGAVADADTTAVSANDLVVNLFYK